MIPDNSYLHKTIEVRSKLCELAIKFYNNNNTECLKELSRECRVIDDMSLSLLKYFRGRYRDTKHF